MFDLQPPRHIPTLPSRRSGLLLTTSFRSTRTNGHHQTGRASPVGATKLHDAMAIDSEFAQALLERNERRRRSIEGLVARIAGEQVSTAARRDAVDLIFALTSCAMFRMLAGARPVAAVRAIITDAIRAAIASCRHHRTPDLNRT
jgi:hypothetical protein